MHRFRNHPSRRLAGLLALLVPFLVGGNACMMAVLTGQGAMSCVEPAQVSKPVPACHAHATSDGAASPGAAARGDAASPCRSKDGSCCDLKPLAAGAAKLAVVVVAPDAQRLAEVASIGVPVPVAVWHGRIIIAGASPPGAGSLVAHRGRAPPLS